MDRLKNKTAIITGAAAGIGLATTRRFIDEGAFVIMTDINRDAGTAASAEFGDRATFLPHDVAREDDWEKVMAAAQERGGPDIFVNNAGILSLGDTQTNDDTDLEHWRPIQRAHVEAVFLGCRPPHRVTKRRCRARCNL